MEGEIKVKKEKEKEAEKRGIGRKDAC